MKNRLKISLLKTKLSISQHIYVIKIFCEINFETNDSDINFILLQRRFDASCIIFKLKIRIIRVLL
jgi:hypothetical protein